MIIPNFKFRYNGINKQFLIFKLIFFLFFIISSNNLYSQLPAFPSATGAGAYVSGGRGYPVYRVTNLNNSGSGSFRQALLDAKSGGGGIIVFTVSGTIVLSSQIYLSGLENITIAGQTAPEGGITIAKETLYWTNVNNLIMRYIRVRPDLGPYVNNVNEWDTFYINGSNYIIDHCSFSWGSDEVASSGVGHGYTFQRNLMGEGTKVGSIMGYSQDQANSYDISIINNMWYNISHRFPNINSDGRVDVINNVAWNYTYRLSSVERNGDFNHMGNYLLHKTNNLTLSSLDDYGCFLESGNPKIHTSGNYLNNVFEDPSVDNWPLWRYVGGGYLPTSMKANTPFPLLGRSFTVKYATDALDDVKYNVGCNARLDENGNVLENIDSVDSVYLNNVQNNVRVPYVILENLNTAHHDAFQASVSTTPLATGYQDSNNDGIPDAWKIAKGFGINDDLTTYVWPSGYVGIEEFLNQIDGNSTGTIDAEGVTVTPSMATLNIPETLQLTTEFIPINASNQSGVWNSSNPSIATVSNSGLVTPVSEGMATITFTSNDGGFSDSASISVTNVVIPVTSVSVTPNDITLDVNETAPLTANILPINATNTSGDWTSSDANVVAVDNQGNITGISEGTAVITFTSNDNNTIFDTANVTVIDTFFGTYELYNAATDVMIQEITGDETFDLNVIGNQINFRAIPQGGDTNSNVESVSVEWTGVESGSWTENSPIYAGLPNGHVDFDFQPYNVMEGVYNFTVTYYSQDNASGDIVSSDNFSLTFISGFTMDAGADQYICEGSNESIELTASQAVSYVWSTGETTQSIIVQPDQTTTYTVTGTDSEGNESSDDVTVTVRPRPVVNAGNDVDIYQNDSITLTATGDGTFVWSSGEETQSITVSPTVTTTYSVTATLNGCTDTDSVIVTVLEPNTVNANAGADRTICENESVTLTASGGTSYLWSTGETTQSIEVSPMVTTTYTVTAYYNDLSDTDDVVVNVNPVPVANAGTDRAILYGEEITLTASGGSEFIWSTGETTQQIVVQPTETTTYTVEVLENGCTDFDQVTVVVGVSASVGGEPSICQGQSTTLYASGGSYFLWNTGETTQSIEVSPTQTTTYSVVVSNNSSSDEAEITVNVNLVPTANAGEDVTIESGQNVTLTAAGGNSYLWSNGQTTQSISVSPDESTVYTVETFVNGCSNTDDVLVTVVQQVNASVSEDHEICFGESTTLTATGGEFFLWNTGEETATILVTPTETTVYTVTVSNGISSQDADVMVAVSDCQAIDLEPESSEFGFIVYPNPTQGRINIKLSGLQNISSIYVSDILGKVLRSESFEPQNGTIINKQYDFSSLSKGIYFITFVQSGEPAITKKVIIQ